MTKFVKKVQIYKQNFQVQLMNNLIIKVLII